jgi:DNA polymerase-3 subunit alpha
MYLKRHHPQAFYAAALTKLSKEKQMSLMRDAERHGLSLLPPDIEDSDEDWKPYGKDGVLAGFRQLPDIGPKLAPLIVEYRDLGEITTWDGLKTVPGVGAKTIEKLYNFVGQEDPFEIHKLEERINKVKREIVAGTLRTKQRQRLPYPTHTTEEVPGNRGQDLEVVWIGTIHNRNVRDLFELNNARGTPLTPEEVKRPDLREWVIMHGEDHTDQMSVTIDRYKYPKFKKMVWSLELDHDLVLVRGVKKGYQARRALYVWDMWVIDPDD